MPMLPTPPDTGTVITSAAEAIAYAAENAISLRIAIIGSGPAGFYAAGHLLKDAEAGFEVDMMHTVHTVDAAMPYLEKSDAGAIVVISSGARAFSET